MVVAVVVVVLHVKLESSLDITSGRLLNTKVVPCPCVSSVDVLHCYSKPCRDGDAGASHCSHRAVKLSVCD